MGRRVPRPVEHAITTSKGTSREHQKPTRPLGHRSACRRRRTRLFVRRAGAGRKAARSVGRCGRACCILHRVAGESFRSKAPLRPDSISASVSALFRKLKLPKGTSLQSLRHSHGSHLLEAGLELPAASERLGHSSVYVTATVYSHLISRRDAEAARSGTNFSDRTHRAAGQANRNVRRSRDSEEAFSRIKSNDER